MVNKRIIWTTATSVKRVAKSFSTIDVTILDSVENDLKCHLRYYQTSVGDVILWNEAFVIDDIASFHRGGKFLDGWADLAFRSEKATFFHYWKQFSNSEKFYAESACSSESPLIIVNGTSFKCSIAKSQEVCKLFSADKDGLHGLPLHCQFTYAFRSADHKILELWAYASKGGEDGSNRTSDSLSTFSTKDKETTKRANQFLEAWVRSVIASDQHRPAVVPSKHFSRYVNSRSKDLYSARIIIRGASEVIVPCRNTIFDIYRAIGRFPQEPEIIELQKQLKFEIKFSPRTELDDPDGVETLMLHICPSDSSDVETAERGTMLATSWAVKAAKDPEYSLLAYLQKSVLIPSSPANDPVPPNPEAEERDWAKYSSTFKVSELDRMVIEEAAKAEASLRMVLDESSGQVIGLEEYARRIRAENGRSANVNVGQERVVDVTEENCSSEVNGSLGCSAKRKLEQDNDGEQVEKKTRM